MSSQFLVAPLEDVDQVETPYTKPEQSEEPTHPTQVPSEEKSGQAEQPASQPSPSNYWNLFKTIGINLLVVLFYLCCTISIILSIRMTSTHFNLRFPLFLLFFQVGFSFFLTLCFLLCATIIDPKRKFAMNRRKQFFYSKLFLRIAPAGLFFGTDYGLSNMALQVVTVSAYTMLKSVVPIIIMIVMFILRLEDPTILLILSILFISGGISLSVYGFQTINIPGFLLVLFAACFAAVRFVYVQTILHKPKGLLLTTIDKEYSEEKTKEPNEDDEADASDQLLSKKEQELHSTKAEEADATTDTTLQKDAVPHVSDLNPIEVLSYFTPMTMLTVLPFAIILEGNRFVTTLQNILFAEQSSDGVAVELTIFLGKIMLVTVWTGLLGFLLVLSEFILIKRTSSLTLSVVGVIRELLLIVAGVLLLGEVMTLLNWAGFAIATIGLVLYKFERFRQLQKEELKEKQDLATK